MRVNEDRARDELESILNRREYQVYYEDNRNSLQIWWDNLKAWLTGWLDEFFFNLGAPAGVANGLLIMVIGILIFVFGFAILRLVRKVQKKRAFQNKKPLQSLKEKHWSFSDHLAEAEKQETQGSYQPAVRHLFLALLLYFDEKEDLKARTWKTNGEYYEELRRVNPEKAEHFYRLAVQFDQVTYGDRPIIKRDYESYRNETLQWMGKEQWSQTGSRRE